MSPERAAHQRELRKLLEEAVLALPDTYRPVYVLRELENLSSAETAAVLQISETLVKVRLHRGRRWLRDQLYSVAGSDTFPFAGERCDRIVARVFQRISSFQGMRPRRELVFH